MGRGKPRRGRAWEKSSNPQQNPLFRFGVDLESVGEDGKTNLHAAAMFSDPEKIKWLVEEGLDVNARDADGQTPLHVAVSSGQALVVRALLDLGANQNAADIAGSAPMHLAASSNSTHAPEIVAELIKYKADINMKDKLGRTALHIAVSGNHQGAVNALLSAGADVEVVDNDGRSILHYAVGKTSRAGCSSQIVDSLLALGMSTNVADASGQTPLHYAAAKGVKSTTQTLIDAGADILAVDNEGRTPQDLAREFRHSRLLDLLEDVHQGPAASMALRSATHRSSPQAALRASPLGDVKKSRAAPRRPLIHSLMPGQDLTPRSPAASRPTTESTVSPEAPQHPSRGMSSYGGADLLHPTPPSARRPVLASVEKPKRIAEREPAPEDRPEGAARGLRAALSLERESLRLEMSITKVQKIQLDSLRRQVQELEKSVMELKASEDRLLQTVDEHEKDLEQVRASRASLQGELDAAEDRAKKATWRADDAERRLADAEFIHKEQAAAAAHVAATQRDAALSAATSTHVAALQLQLAAARSDTAVAERQLRQSRLEHDQEVADLHKKLEEQDVKFNLLKNAYDDLASQARKTGDPVGDFDDAFEDGGLSSQGGSSLWGHLMGQGLRTPRPSQPAASNGFSPGEMVVRSNSTTWPITATTPGAGVPRRVSELSPGGSSSTGPVGATPNGSRPARWALPLDRLFNHPGLVVPAAPSARATTTTAGPADFGLSASSFRCIATATLPGSHPVSPRPEDVAYSQTQVPSPHRQNLQSGAGTPERTSASASSPSLTAAGATPPFSLGAADVRTTCEEPLGQVLPLSFSTPRTIRSDSGSDNVHSHQPSQCGSLSPPRSGSNTQAAELDGLSVPHLPSENGTFFTPRTAGKGQQQIDAANEPLHLAKPLRAYPAATSARDPDLGTPSGPPLEANAGGKRMHTDADDALSPAKSVCADPPIDGSLGPTDARPNLDASDPAAVCQGAPSPEVPTGGGDGLSTPLRGPSHGTHSPLSFPAGLPCPRDQPPSCPSTCGTGTRPDDRACPSPQPAHADGVAASRSDQLSQGSDASCPGERHAQNGGVEGPCGGSVPGCAIAGISGTPSEGPQVAAATPPWGPAAAQGADEHPPFAAPEAASEVEERLESEAGLLQGAVLLHGASSTRPLTTGPSLDDVSGGQASYDREDGFARSSGTSPAEGLASASPAHVGTSSSPSSAPNSPWEPLGLGRPPSDKENVPPSPAVEQGWTPLRPGGEVEERRQDRQVPQKHWGPAAVAGLGGGRQDPSVTPRSSSGRSTSEMEGSWGPEPLPLDVVGDLAPSASPVLQKRRGRRGGALRRSLEIPATAVLRAMAIASAKLASMQPAPGSAVLQPSAPFPAPSSPAVVSREPSGSALAAKPAAGKTGHFLRTPRFMHTPSRLRWSRVPGDSEPLQVEPHAVSTAFVLPRQAAEDPAEDCQRSWQSAVTLTPCMDLGRAAAQACGPSCESDEGREAEKDLVTSLNDLKLLSSSLSEVMLVPAIQKCGTGEAHSHSAAGVPVRTPPKPVMTGLMLATPAESFRTPRMPVRAFRTPAGGLRQSQENSHKTNVQAARTSEPELHM
eukprot:jgi/Botrbrau1/663/Bobra.0161s0048.2